MKGLRKSEAAKKVGTYEVEKKVRQERESRAWEDNEAPENTDYKRARLEVQSKTTNPKAELIFSLVSRNEFYKLELSGA